MWVDAWTGVSMSGSVTVPAALDQIPYWYRAGSLVPMYARYADTLLPATAPGVTSYADPALGSELRLIFSAGGTGTTQLHDGATASADGTTLTFTAGGEYTVATFELAKTSVTSVSVGGTMLPEVADVTTCAAPGCWNLTGTKLQVRMFGGTATVQ